MVAGPGDLTESPSRLTAATGSRGQITKNRGFIGKSLVPFYTRVSWRQGLFCASQPSYRAPNGTRGDKIKVGFSSPRLGDFDSQNVGSRKIQRRVPVVLGKLLRPDVSEPRTRFALARIPRLKSQRLGAPARFDLVLRPPHPSGGGDPGFVPTCGEL